MSMWSVVCRKVNAVRLQKHNDGDDCNAKVRLQNGRAQTDGWVSQGGCTLGGTPIFLPITFFERTLWNIRTCWPHSSTWAQALYRLHTRGRIMHPAPCTHEHSVDVRTSFLRGQNTWMVNYPVIYCTQSNIHLGGKLMVSDSGSLWLTNQGDEEVFDY